jgi:hypothetical protein
VPGAMLAVERMDGRRIDRVRVTVHPADTHVTRTDDPAATRTDDGAP